MAGFHFLNIALLLGATNHFSEPSRRLLASFFASSAPILTEKVGEDIANLKFPDKRQAAETDLRSMGGASVVSLIPILISSNQPPEIKLAAERVLRSVADPQQVLPFVDYLHSSDPNRVNYAKEQLLLLCENLGEAASTPTENEIENKVRDVLERSGETYSYVQILFHDASSLPVILTARQFDHVIRDYRTVMTLDRQYFSMHQKQIPIFVAHEKTHVLKNAELAEKFSAVPRQIASKILADALSPIEGTTLLKWTEEALYARSEMAADGYAKQYLKKFKFSRVQSEDRDLLDRHAEKQLQIYTNALDRIVEAAIGSAVDKSNGKNFKKWLESELYIEPPTTSHEVGPPYDHTNNHPTQNLSRAA